MGRYVISSSCPIKLAISECLTDKRVATACGTTDTVVFTSSTTEKYTVLPCMDWLIQQKAGISRTPIIDPITVAIKLTGKTEARKCVLTLTPTLLNNAVK